MTMTTTTSRGQQTKGSSYDTTLEFFDTIDPQVSEASDRTSHQQNSLLFLDIEISENKSKPLGIHAEEARPKKTFLETIDQIG